MKRTIISLIMLSLAICLGSCQKPESNSIVGGWNVYSFVSRVGAISEEYGYFIDEMSFEFKENGQGMVSYKLNSGINELIIADSLTFNYTFQEGCLKIEEGGYAHSIDYELVQNDLIIDLAGTKLFRNFWGLDEYITIKMTRQ